ncbi:MAG: aldo/keto reductase, partial [Gemmatimonadales bacterium]
CSTAQLALAWLLAQDPAIVPIPGTRSAERLHENAAAVGIALSTAELERLETVISSVQIHGTRYPSVASALLFGDTPEKAPGAGRKPSRG